MLLFVRPGGTRQGTWLVRPFLFLFVDRGRCMSPHPGSCTTPARRPKGRASVSRQDDKSHSIRKPHLSSLTETSYAVRRLLRHVFPIYAPWRLIHRKSDEELCCEHRDCRLHTTSPECHCTQYCCCSRTDNAPSHSADIAHRTHESTIAHRGLLEQPFPSAGARFDLFEAMHACLSRVITLLHSSPGWKYM